MTVNAHAFPSLNLALNATTTPAPALVGSTALNAALLGNGFFLGGTAGVPNSTTSGLTTWTTIKAGGTGGAATEASGTGYSAGGLVLVAADLAAADSFLTATSYTSITYSGTIQWTGATFTAYQAVFYFNGSPTQGICWWDFGGAQSCSSGTFTLTLGTGSNSVANCLVQYSDA